MKTMITKRQDSAMADVLQLLQQAEAKLPSVPELKPAGEVLAEAETLLPVPLSAHTAECDRWCRVWMLLVGGWYSLNWAAVFSDKSDERSLLQRLRHGHRLARFHLDSLGQSQGLSADDMGGWYAGYFLISAEHRIADGFERATGLFVKDTEIKNLGVFSRCKKLACACPHCHNDNYLGDGLETFTAFRHNGTDALVVVHDRVIAIKHGSEDQRGGKDRQPVSDLPAAKRLAEATRALEKAAIGFRALVRHKKECVRPVIR